MKISPDIGFVHFIGIGGIGMSGIAEVLNNLGYKVQGSDQSEGSNIERLRKQGIHCFIGHDPKNIDSAEIVVISSAIQKDNVELQAARAQLLPIVRRAEMLVELMRFRKAIAISGTHGKTTTTSIVSALLDSGGFDPTVINGGIINVYGTNTRMGDSAWMVVEADESDGSFLKLPAEIAVVTNIDPEHLDHYGSIEKIRNAFYCFVENIPFYGFAVMCTDHPEVEALVSRIEDRRIVTYGENAQANVRFMHYRVKNMRSFFDVAIYDRKSKRIVTIENLELPMPGTHNVSNATAAIAVAWELGLSESVIRSALLSFGGIRRRFTFVGSWKEAKIFDDYAHHPVEIKSVLKAARETAEKNRVIAILQPHRFSRVRDLFDDFAACLHNADIVMVAPIYAAGEAPIEDISSEILVDRIRSGGHRDVRFVHGLSDIVLHIRDIAQKGDIFIFLGAGNITQWAYSTFSMLESEIS